MSVAVVPDRFFSIYGKAYPIKRRQTVGINQPSEAFKYEIIYLRGYDKYDDEQPQAKIIYHKQQENFEKTKACATTDDDIALKYLDDMTGYPYLKLRVCYDGSVRAYLGSKDVDWDLTRQIEDNYAGEDTAWVEIPQINTDQFRGIDLWLRFDSINALSYYLMTKYENNIFDIGPKEIEPGLPQDTRKVELIEKEVTEDVEDPNTHETHTVTHNVPFYHVPAGTYQILEFPDDYEFGFIRGGQGPAASSVAREFTYSHIMEEISQETVTSLQKKVIFTIANDHDVRQLGLGMGSGSAIWLSLLKENNLVDDLDKTEFTYADNPRLANPFSLEDQNGYAEAEGSYRAEDQSTMPGHLYIPLVREIIDPDTEERTGTAVIQPSSFIGVLDQIIEKPVKQVVGLDYELKEPDWTEDGTGCVPCCKKDNLSRAIWAYVNPRTMTPYDDDYWFHQGEPYYKKSLTLSTKQNPLNAQKIYVEQGVFPGMYKIVAETYIRARDTGEDQRVQITLPLCKIKSDQTLTLQADGDPTTFNLDVEVATPQNGVPMEITFYEVEKEMKQGCSGGMVPKDGSTKISAK